MNKLFCYISFHSDESDEIFYSTNYFFKNLSIGYFLTFVTLGEKNV